MVKVRGAPEGTPATGSLPPGWDKDVKRLPNGQVEIELPDDLLAEIEALALPGETHNDTIKRLLAVADSKRPTDGTRRRRR